MMSSIKYLLDRIIVKEIILEIIILFALDRSLLDRGDPVSS